MTLYEENGGIDQTYLLNYILSNTLGLGGTVIFGLAILLATFTTALGCLGLASEYFSSISGRKISYKAGVFAYAIIGFVVAVILSTTPSGVQTLLNLTLPFFLTTMPITVVLIVLNLFSEKIRNDNVYRGAAITAGIWGAVYGISYIVTVGMGNFGSPLTMALPAYGVPGGAVFNAFFGPWNFIYTLTGDLGYIIPSIIGAVIGACVKKGGYSERPYLREHAGDESFDYAALKAKKAAAGAA
jgi:LIVCS family branched-chain amino acid:cation transporter